MRPASWVIAAALLVGAGPAHAQESGSRAVVDQVTLEPASIGGQRLHVHLSALSLQGQVLDVLDSKSVKLLVNGSRLDAPFGIGRYGATSSDTAIVIIVQSSIDYAEVLPVIVDALDQNVLAVSSDRTQVAILPYGESLGAGKLGSLKAARKKLGSLTSDGSVGDPLLLDTLERALGMLKKAKTDPVGRPLRKIVVVIGDGRDSSADRDRVIRIGTRAAKDDVRIHTFAYSPRDLRRPLLLLGELSKRSLGTFRWVRGARTDSWTPAFQQLQAEIARQLVLTFYLPNDEDLSNKKLKIVTTGRVEVTSNEHKIPEVGCAGQPCEPGAYCVDRCVSPRAESGRGVLGWVVVVGGIIVGAIVLLGVIGWFITKRQQAAVAQPSVPLAPGSVPPAPVVKTKPPKSKPPKLAPAPPASIAPPAPITGPRFYVMTGPRTGEEIALRHGFLIGKAPGCDLLIDDGYTSGHHAQIGMDHFGNCRIYDRGSTNGSFVNGVRTTEYVLEHGNTVKIGSTELRFLAQ